jgi:prepilin peptidase CpaA
MRSIIFWRAAILGFVVAAAYCDLRWRKLPRGAMLAGIVAGLAVNFGLGHFTDAALTALLAFGVSLGLFSLGAIGGGDVKLITALGAILRFQGWTIAMEVAIFAAAAMALVQVIRHGALRQTMRNIGDIFRSYFTVGLRAHPVLTINNQATLRSPFAVAAALGVLWVVLR